MYLTMLASASNFGGNKILHTKLNGVFGWRTMAMFGLIIQLFLNFTIPYFQKWIEAGEIYQEVDGKASEKDPEESH